MSEKLFYMRSYSMSLGINVNAADISIGERAVDGLSLTENSKNISFGRRAGISSRYGMMQVPGQNTEQIVREISSGEFDNIFAYTLDGMTGTLTQPTNGATRMDKRAFIFGVVPILRAESGNPLHLSPYWITLRDEGNDDYQICLLKGGASDRSPSEVFKIENEVGFGGARLSTPYATSDTEANRTFKAVDRLHTNDLSALKIEKNLYYPEPFMKFAQATSTILTNIKEFVGWSTLGSSLKHDVDPTTFPYDVSFGKLGTPFWFTPKTNFIDRSLKVSQGGDNSTTFLNILKQWDSKGNIGNGDNSAPTRARYAKTRGLTFGNNAGWIQKIDNTIWSDNGGTYNINSRMLFVETDDVPFTATMQVLAMVVNRAPKIVLFNDRIKDSDFYGAQGVSPSAIVKAGTSDDMQQWVDPVDTMWKPKSYETADASVPANRYYEGTTTTKPYEKKTCWALFPKFEYGTNTAGVVANTGVLSDQTTYEISYSIYNTMTGKESNVGVPAKIFTGTVSNSGFLVHNANHAPFGFSANTLNVGDSKLPGLADMFPDSEASSIESMPVNYLYYRFYYREVGSFEWLYSGELSFASAYFKADNNPFYIGANNGIGVVGGQPGGFNDYSDLPSDDYIDVKAFGDRLFWLTNSTLRYSLSSDKLSYPATSFSSISEGSFLGMIEHYFAGQSKQDGRLVVFGTEGIYDGSFTGNLQLEQVRVSSTAQPQQVPKDGSDFILKRRGSETAFSGRTAVVAEGILYFSGPTGIYRDSGVDLPVKISQPLEPLLLDDYDKGRTHEFFSYFNKKSREILFFYKPKEEIVGQLTKAWVYSLRTMGWTQYVYADEIDWAQNYEYKTSPSTNPGNPTKELGGERTMIGMRSSSSSKITSVRFHDDGCPSGDVKFGTSKNVINISKDGSNLITMTLSTGETVSSPTEVAIVNARGYTRRTYNDSTAQPATLDGHYDVVASTATTIQIEVSASTYAAINAGTMSTNYSIPLLVLGLHEFESVIESEYLCPITMDRWIEARYLHLLFQPISENDGSVIPNLEVTWRMNHEIGSNSDTKTLPLTKLESGETTTQIYTDLLNSAMTTSGQAIKYTMKYNQLFDRYTLFTMTTQYRDKGTGEIKYYQRENG